MTLAQFIALLRQHRNSEERNDYRAALVCAVMANIHRDPKKSKVYKPEDFMPGPGKASEKKEMNDEEMLSQLKLMNASLGGETHE